MSDWLLTKSTNVLYVVFYDGRKPDELIDIFNQIYSELGIEEEKRRIKHVKIVKQGVEQNFCYFYVCNTLFKSVLNLTDDYEPKDKLKHCLSSFFKYTPKFPKEDQSEVVYDPENTRVTSLDESIHIECYNYQVPRENEYSLFCELNRIRYNNEMITHFYNTLRKEMKFYDTSNDNKSPLVKFSKEKNRLEVSVYFTNSLDCFDYKQCNYKGFAIDYMGKKYYFNFVVYDDTIDEYC